MVHASLFTGIGGFELAAEWMGWTNLFHCEIDPFPRKVTQYYWPKSISYEDIRNTDFTIHRGAVDILTGGFPCQPYSTAGKRLGTADERHLWPDMCRAIREIQPTWVVGENVRGIVSWNDGMVFEEVQADLEAQGYEVQSLVLPAAGVGAPHIRQRVFFIAYSASNRRIRQRKKVEEKAKQKRLQQARQLAGRSQRSRISQSITHANRFTSNKGNSQKFNTNRIGTIQKYISKRSSLRNRIKTIGRKWTATHPPIIRTRTVSNNIQTATANTNSARRQKLHIPSISSQSRFSSRAHHATNVTHTVSFRRWDKSDWKRKSKLLNKNSKGNHWQDFPTQSPVCSGNDGIPAPVDRYTIPEITLRRKSIEAYGNAVVPQLILQIFKTIEKYNSNIIN